MGSSRVVGAVVGCAMAGGGRTGCCGCECYGRGCRCCGCGRPWPWVPWPGSPHGVPGLKSTMARRQPSSVLSMCMSRILDTSSVRTLQGGGRTPRPHQTVPTLPQKRPCSPQDSQEGRGRPCSCHARPSIRHTSPSLPRRALRSTRRGSHRALLWDLETEDPVGPSHDEPGPGHGHPELRRRGGGAGGAA